MATRKSAPKAPTSRAANDSNDDAPIASPAGKGAVAPGTLHAATAATATDVFAARPAATSTSSATATKADSGTTNSRDLTDEQQRMADSRGKGIAGATSGRKIGETDDPDTSSWQRPGATDRPAGPGEFADSPFGDRHDALRNGPESESENPLDSFGKIPDRGADLLAATGQGGGLNAAAASLHTLPQSGQGAPDGKEMIADGWWSSIPVVGPLTDMAIDVVDAVDTLGDLAVDAAIKHSETDEPSEYVRDLLVDFLKTNKAAEEKRLKESYEALPLVPITPDAAGGVKDPGGSEDQTWNPPPGWIGGDAILPPGLRTGAVIGGAKGNDGVDWANQRWGASNPDPNASGGGGRPSAGEVWRQKQTNESLLGQPDPYADDGGGASVPTWAERQNRVSNPTGTDRNPEYGKGPEESEAVNTDPTQNDVSHLWGSGDESDDVAKAAVRLITVRSDDTDTDD